MQTKLLYNLASLLEQELYLQNIQLHHGNFVLNLLYIIIIVIIIVIVAVNYNYTSSNFTHVRKFTI